MELELINFLQGLFSLIFVVVSIIVGIRIILRYFEYQKREFLLIGVAWIGMILPWFPDAINLLLIIYFDTLLSEEAYLIIGLALIPAFLLCFEMGLTDLLHTDKQKLVLIITSIISVFYEIYFWYYIFTDTSQIGIFLNPFLVEFNIFIEIYFAFGMLIILITGILFARQSIKSENPEIKLKGKLLLAAFIFWEFGTVLELFIPYTAFSVVITRCILITGSIFFYFGFLLKISESEEEKEDVQEFLEMVAKHKHKKITEEEVTFYREQKICLICKGKAIKYIYVCQGCNALYCLKCANALSNLENACWVCNARIDESKPAKPFEPKDDDDKMKMSIKIQK